MRDKEVLKQLIKAGWQEVRITGSHHIMVRGDMTIPVPVHGKEMPTGLAHSILKKAGLK